MMTYEECMAAILLSPEDDRPRYDLANSLRAADPTRAEFIETQLEEARVRREQRYRMSSDLETRGDRLLGGREFEWARDLDFYLGEEARHRRIEYDRGLPWLCMLNPYMFLEQGEQIVSNIAPLRGIQFYDDPEGSPFPMKELAASPLLARFDEIRLHECKLSNEDLLAFAASPNLERLLDLDLRAWGVYEKPMPTIELLDALGANPLTRKCLQIRTHIRAADNGEIGEFTAHDEYGNYIFEMSAEGHELERKHGYLPWLHHADGLWCSPDTHYWVEQKVLPLFPPGSPIDPSAAPRQGVMPTRPVAPRSAAAQFLVKGAY
jgi:hypothetical protein